MAVTKRTRFEVLRRDNHTCQYCGAKAPDVTLHIDHVMPVSLGGDDKPGNLVTACKDCNSGKSSITPGSPLVQGLSERAAAYALGMQDKMTRFRAEFEALEEYTRQFREEWDSWGIDRNDGTRDRVPLPGDYEITLFRWQRVGVPIKAISIACAKAMSKTGIRGEFGEFNYMAGILTSMLDQREIDLSVDTASVAVCTAGELNDLEEEAYWRGRGAAWPDGYEAGYSEALEKRPNRVAQMREREASNEDQEHKA